MVSLLEGAADLTDMSFLHLPKSLRMCMLRSALWMKTQLSFQIMSLSSFYSRAFSLHNWNVCGIILAATASSSFLSVKEVYRTRCWWRHDNISNWKQEKKKLPINASFVCQSTASEDWLKKSHWKLVCWHLSFPRYLAHCFLTKRRFSSSSLYFWDHVRLFVQQYRHWIPLFLLKDLARSQDLNACTFLEE